MEAARNLKANLKLEGQTCVACKTGLKLGDDASVCNGCQGPHHARCWNGYGGCATKECVNAPLRRLDVPTHSAPAVAPAAPLPPGALSCPSCGQTNSQVDALCLFCRRPTSPDGIYRGPRTNAPGAVSSMVLGIVGFIVCGVVFGPIAIAQASSAKRELALNPYIYKGGGFATAGMVLGILDLVAFALLMMYRSQM